MHEPRFPPDMIPANDVVANAFARLGFSLRGA